MKSKALFPRVKDEQKNKMIYLYTVIYFSICMVSNMKSKDELEKKIFDTLGLDKT